MDYAAEAIEPKSRSLVCPAPNLTRRTSAHEHKASRVVNPGLYSWKLSNDPFPREVSLFSFSRVTPLPGPSLLGSSHLGPVRKPGRPAAGPTYLGGGVCWMLPRNVTYIGR